jgi:hypothetical protein
MRAQEMSIVEQSCGNFGAASDLRALAGASNGRRARAASRVRMEWSAVAESPC